MKTSLCREEFGYDAAIDYKATDDLDGALAAACPNGVDVDYDNTAGPISDAALRRLAIGARIVICGTAGVASWDPPPPPPCRASYPRQACAYARLSRLRLRRAL